MRSVIFTLVDPVQCCILSRGLPNNGIKFLNRETLNPTSFPGWPAFGDVLCDGGSKTFIGLTFHVRRDRYPIAKHLSSRFSPDIAELKEFGIDDSLGIYKDYPESCWLEIKWSSIPPNHMVDVQTCHVLWYPSSNSLDNEIPIAIGIENLDYLIKETDYDLLVPTKFPFPHLKIEFMND